MPDFYLYNSQCFGFGLEPDFIRPVDPDTDPGDQK
jgi:hypothetical protein